MSDLNLVELCGTIQTPMELRTTVNANKLSNFTLKVDRKPPSTASDYIPIVAWGDLAQEMTQQCKRGDRINVQGSLQKTFFINKEGIRTYVTQVQANTFHKEEA